MVISDAVHTLERELREIFGGRLQSLIVYGQRAQPAHRNHAGHGHDGPPTHTLAIVDSMTPQDLRACALRVETWHGAGLATPLLLADHEFERSLDAFPLEFGAILADHTVVAGANPFAALAVDPADLRRACEVQARSHLLHLREGFLETRGRADALSVLIVQSAAAFAALHHQHRATRGSRRATTPRRRRAMWNGFSGRLPVRLPRSIRLAGAHDLPSADAERLFAPYLEAVERIVRYVDGWNSAQ